MHKDICDENFELKETDFGIELTFFDYEIGDEFSDYLAEKCYVFFNVKFEGNHYGFLFGQASSTEKVGLLIRKFYEFRNPRSAFHWDKK